MKIFSSLHLLAALGVLGAATGASSQVDTSQWKCTSCPYPKGTTGSVDGGIGTVTDSSQKFGDYTGLDRKGAFAIVDGTVSHRGDDGYWADLWAADLGLDNRRLLGQAGREGVYSVNLGYAEIPRNLADGARTPFLGNGGNVLTLPAGFPAADTASMPLGSTLQPIDIGFKYKRFDLGGSFIGGEGWSANLSLRHDERDGTRPTAGSFLTTASQFVAPVNEETDQLELSVAYVTRRLQATLSYQFSSFRNENSGLTWSNPFFPVVPGATTGQLALAPDNQFHQTQGNGGLRHHADDARDRRVGLRPHDAGRRLPRADREPAARADRAAPSRAIPGRGGRHVQRRRQADRRADGGSARDGQLRTRQPRQRDAGAQLSDRHDRHVCRGDAAQQHAVQLHARPLQAARRLRGRLARQHAAHWRCRATTCASAPTRKS